MRISLLDRLLQASLNGENYMNRWQYIFVIFGMIAVMLLAVFPPQYSMGTVQFLPFSDGYPVDWMRLFLWVVAVLFFSGLGFAANRQEHR